MGRNGLLGFRSGKKGSHDVQKRPHSEIEPQISKKKLCSSLCNTKDELATCQREEMWGKYILCHPKEEVSTDYLDG